MNVLITGGAGYIGAALTEKLTAIPEVENVVVYDNLSRDKTSFFFHLKPKYPKKISFVEADILDGRRLQKALEGIDVVYHLAAKVTTPFSERGAHYFEQVNHWGTAQVASTVEQSSVKRIIYMSSASVYGSSKKEHNKNSSVAPATPYGFSKYRGEKHIIRLAGKKEVFVLRCANTFGYSPAMRMDSVVNKFIFKAHHGQVIHVNGSGEQVRPFIHLDRVVAFLVSCLTHVVSPEKPAVFDVSDYNVSVLTLIEHLRALYPDLQMLFINQHLEMKELKLTLDPDVLERIGPTKKKLSELLLQTKNRFALNKQ